MLMKKLIIITVEQLSPLNFESDLADFLPKTQHNKPPAIIANISQSRMIYSLCPIIYYMIYLKVINVIRTHDFADTDQYSRVAQQLFGVSVHRLGERDARTIHTAVERYV